MNSRKWSLIGALVLSAAAFNGFAIVPAMGSPAVLTVGPLSCPGAAYPTINSAVLVATAGDTIKVCAGIYSENVLVTKQLTFLGAQAGKDGRFRNSPAKESVVNNAFGDFTLIGLANRVKIDGFTISGAGAMAGPNFYGIEAFQGTSGLVVTNNIIAGNREGMNFQNPDASMPSSIQRNAFRNNSAGGAGPEGGTGIFISNGPANNTAIANNSFTGHYETAINFAGNAASRSIGLSVKRNVSVDDSTFVVATNSVGAVISQNAVFVRPGVTHGTGILDFGNNRDLSIDSNLVYGGATTDTSGIRVRNLTLEGPSVSTRVTNNLVFNRYNGVRVTETTGATVSNNSISGSSNDGILIESVANNNFVSNTVRASANHDCEDRTFGAGTAGTANNWVGNSGDSNNSLPAAICPSAQGDDNGQ